MTKEKLFIGFALAIGALMFCGAIFEGVRHSVTHGAIKPTRTEFNALVEQNKRLLQRQDSDFVKITTMMHQIISIQKSDQQYNAVQDDFILDLRADLDRVINNKENK